MKNNGLSKESLVILSDELKADRKFYGIKDGPYVVTVKKRMECPTCGRPFESTP